MLRPTEPSTGRSRWTPRSPAPINTPPTSPATQGAGSNYTNPRIEPPDHGIGRSRGGLTSKIHHLVDGAGRPLVVLVVAGQAHDAPVFDHLMAHLCVTAPARASRGPAPTVSAATRRTPVEPSALICAGADHRGDPRTSDQDAIVNDAARAVAGHQPSIPRITRAATSSNAASTPSSSGAAWPPATTNSHSSIAAAPYYEPSPSGAHLSDTP